MLQRHRKKNHAWSLPKELTLLEREDLNIQTKTSYNEMLSRVVEAISRKEFSRIHVGWK